MASTIDANTKVNLGILLAILGLGAGGIWKMSNIDARLDNLERTANSISAKLDGFVTRNEFEGRVGALERRVFVGEKDGK